MQSTHIVHLDARANGAIPMTKLISSIQHDMTASEAEAEDQNNGNEDSAGISGMEMANGHETVQ
jgi:hypothetical protein